MWEGTLQATENKSVISKLAVKSWLSIICLAYKICLAELTRTCATSQQMSDLTYSPHQVKELILDTALVIKNHILHSPVSRVELNSIGLRKSIKWFLLTYATHIDHFLIHSSLERIFFLEAIGNRCRSIEPELQRKSKLEVFIKSFPSELSALCWMRGRIIVRFKKIEGTMRTRLAELYKQGSYDSTKTELL